MGRRERKRERDRDRDTLRNLNARDEENHDLSENRRLLTQEASFPDKT